jgi:hypothetical protein
MSVVTFCPTFGSIGLNNGNVIDISLEVVLKINLFIK